MGRTSWELSVNWKNSSVSWSRTRSSRTQLIKVWSGIILFQSTSNCWGANLLLLLELRAYLTLKHLPTGLLTHEMLYHLPQTISYMDSLVVNLHLKPSTPQSSAHQMMAKTFHQSKSCGKSCWFVCQQFGLKRWLIFWLTFCLKNVIFLDYVFHAFAQTSHQPVWI